MVGDVPPQCHRAKPAGSRVIERHDTEGSGSRAQRAGSTEERSRAEPEQTGRDTTPIGPEVTREATSGYKGDGLTPQVSTTKGSSGQRAHRLLSQGNGTILAAR